MIKKLLVAALGLAMLTPSFAELNATQKQVLKSLRADTYVNIIVETSEYTTVSTNKGIITFIGKTGAFTTEKVYAFDNKKGIVDPVAQSIYKELDKNKAGWIAGPKATKPTAHAYVIFSIRCKYCKQLINEAKSYAQAGINMTFVPFYNKQDEKKYSYILEQPAAKRFDFITKTPEQIPNARNNHKLMETSLNLVMKYGIDSYPIIVLDSGKMITGYVSASELAAYTK